MNRIHNLIVDRVRARNVEVNQTGAIGIFIAGPIDEDYDPKVDNHHWEIATLADVAVLALVIDLDCCDVIDDEFEKIEDCHGSLSLDTNGKEHTLGVLVVIPQGVLPNVWVPLGANAAGGTNTYLPVAVTFIGRSSDEDYVNVVTQWHEELLKFFIPIGAPWTP